MNAAILDDGLLLNSVHLALELGQLSGGLFVALDEKCSGPKDDYCGRGCHRILCRLAILGSGLCRCRRRHALRFRRQLRTGERLVLNRRHVGRRYVGRFRRAASERQCRKSGRNSITHGNPQTPRGDHPIGVRQAQWGCIRSVNSRPARGRAAKGTTSPIQKGPIGMERGQYRLYRARNRARVRTGNGIDRTSVDGRPDVLRKKRPRTEAIR